MKSMDCKQTCENGRSEEIIYKIEEIKCNNMMKEYKMWLTLIMSQWKTLVNIIQTELKFLIIHTEH